MDDGCVPGQDGKVGSERVLSAQAKGRREQEQAAETAEERPVRVRRRGEAVSGGLHPK